MIGFFVKKAYIMNTLCMHVTGSGWFFFILILLSVIITVKIVKRQNTDENKKASGCLSFGYIFLVVSSIFLLGAGIVGMLVNQISNIVPSTKYEAKVTDYYSYKSSGKNRTTMYTPIVSFKDNKGIQVEKEADMSYGDPPDIGSSITVGYEEGSEKVTILSSTKYFMLLGMATMAFILVFCMLLGFNYAFKISNKKLFAIGMGFLFYYLIPAGMILLFYGCAYAGVYQFIIGNRPDMPIWAFIVCLFFSIVLFFVIIGWFKNLLRRNR